jgi:protein-S-isoprenylcysteine O-methyltransferase Ste14
MATPIAARLPEYSTQPLTFRRRLLIFLIERRVALSVGWFSLLVAFDMLALAGRPYDVLNLASPAALAGLGLVMAGLVLRSWAAGTLRKYKQLITTGPYALVRNPLYVGSFLMMAGFATLVGGIWTSCLTIGPMIVLYWLAVRDEELVLASYFPDQWPAYAARVPRFLPRLGRPSLEGWSLKQWRHNHEHNAWIGSLLALAALRVWWMLVG